MTQEEADRTRGELLDVAQRLHEAEGLDGMSFRAIAAAYGCSPTKPYSYFESKADLVDGLRVRAYEWIRDVLVTASSAASEPMEALRSMAHAYVRAGLDRPQMYGLLYSAEGAMPEAEPRLLAAKVGALSVCQGVIEAAVADGRLTLATDAETAAHTFWVGAHGLVSLELGGFLVVGRSVEQLLDPLITTLIEGLKEESA